MENIGIEGTSLISRNPSGISVYTKNLIDGLLPDEKFNELFRLNILYKFSRIKHRNFPYKPENVKCYRHLKGLLPLKSFKLLHTTDNIFLENRRAKKVVTIHDLAIFNNNHNIPYYTSDATKEKTFSFLKNVSKKADAIICVSNSTKNDFLKSFNFPAEKISVIHLGVRDFGKASNYILDKLKLTPRKYLLFTGMISVRKNLLNLLKAYDLSSLKDEYKLVMAGSPSMGIEKIIEEIDNRRLNDRVVLSGYLSNSEIKELLENAASFVFPTYYEGFGMPIIEAMSHGLPVVTGDRGAAPEIASGLGIEVDPFDILSIKEGLEKACLYNTVDSAKRMNHAAKFTWKKCAEETRSLYLNLLS